MEKTRQMTTAMATEAIKQRIINLLLEASFWRILVHVKPDGDALGSASALAAAGAALGKKVQWGGADQLPLMYSFLPYTTDYCRYETLPRDGALTVCLDTSTVGRSIPGLVAEDVDINIDHHPDNPRFGKLCWVEPGAAAVGEMLCSLIPSLGCSMGRNIALPLYVAMVTDTGGFSYSNTTAETLKAAAALLESGISPVEVDEMLYHHDSLSKLHLWGRALSRAKRIGKRSVLSWLSREDFDSTGAGEEDTEGLVNELTRMKAVDMTVLVIETEKELRCSVRSRGDCSAQAFAAHWGGGGHKYAAGCRLSLPLERGVALLEEALYVL